jgi:flagellar biosynthesis GTPase FlhF
MSEKLQHHEHHEHHEAHEHAPSAERQAKPEAAPERTPDQHAAELKAIQATIEKEAKHSREVAIDRQEKSEPSQLRVTQQVKQAAYDRLIARTRKHLSAPNRWLSDVTHQPAVDALSRASEKTIARPTPLLWGGFFALLGSTILLYMAKRNGYPYNLAVFFVLFVIGFGFGLTIDVARFLMRRGRTGS